MSTIEKKESWGFEEHRKGIRIPRHPFRSLAVYIRKIHEGFFFSTLAVLVRKLAKVKPTRVAIMTNTYRYTCNPKYIYEYLHSINTDLEIVWIIRSRKDKNGYPPGTGIAYLASLRGAYWVYSAKLWLDNGIAFSSYFDRKPEQIHVQTMHGSLGIKKLDNAVISRNRSRRGRKIVHRESEYTDFVVTNSKFEEDVFRRVFWKNTPMIRLGHARTDILFSKDTEQIGRIRRCLQEVYGVPEEKRIFLYAPTHRYDMTADDLLTDFDGIRAALLKRFGEEYAIVVRLHDRTRNIMVQDPSVYDLSVYPDMQEIMMVTDIGVTDYSSWIFDYVLTRRPGFIFATDADRYESKTGLCYPLDTTPFPVALTQDRLIENILQFDHETYLRKVEDFLEEKQSVDDGHSTERIVNWLRDSVLSDT